MLIHDNKLSEACCGKYENLISSIMLEFKKDVECSERMEDIFFIPVDFYFLFFFVLEKSEL